MSSAENKDVKTAVGNRANRQLAQLISDLKKTFDEANWFKKLFFPSELRQALLEQDEHTRIGIVCDVLIFLNPWRLQYWLFPILKQISANATIQKLKQAMEGSYEDSDYDWAGYHYLGHRSWDWSEIRTKIINRQDPAIATDSIEQGYHEIFYKPPNPEADPDSLRGEIWSTILNCYPGREYLAALSVRPCFEYGYYDVLGKTQFGRKSMVIRDWQEMLRVVMSAKHPKATIVALDILKEPWETKMMYPGNVKLLLTYREAISQKEDPVKFARELRRFNCDFLQKHSQSLIKKTPDALIKLQRAVRDIYNPSHNFFKSDKRKHTYTSVKVITQTNKHSL